MKPKFGRHRMTSALRYAAPLTLPDRHVEVGLHKTSLLCAERVVTCAGVTCAITVTPLLNISWLVKAMHWSEVFTVHTGLVADLLCIHGRWNMRMVTRVRDCCHVTHTIQRHRFHSWLWRDRCCAACRHLLRHQYSTANCQEKVWLQLHEARCVCCALTPARY